MQLVNKTVGRTNIISYGHAFHINSPGRQHATSSDVREFFFFQWFPWVPNTILIVLERSDFHLRVRVLSLS